jgi:hypothetical protein
MKPNEIEQWISGPRFAPFLDCANGNHQHALEIYVWHANLTAACFQVVHHFEVLLRNTVDRALGSRDSGLAAESSWMLNAVALPPNALIQVEAVLRRSAKDGVRPTKDRLISSLPFSFWVHIFGRSPKCEALWRGALHEEFPGVARRKDVLVRLESLRKFRNRLAHHDSLLSLNVRARHETMLEVAGWISPDAKRWLEGESTVGEVLSERP